MICIANTDPKPDCLFAFTGHPFDKEVGLQSNEIRHFDPTVGRWMDEDHIGYEPDGDLYRYPANRPE
jgi:RHS repeat-associated protein